MNSKSQLVKWIAAGIALVIGIWLLWGAFGARWMFALVSTAGGESPSIDKLGQMGDLFGGVNALFAALAFLGVAVASVFQYKTLRLVEEQRAVDGFEPLFFKLLERANGEFGNSLRSMEHGGEVTLPEALGPLYLAAAFVVARANESVSECVRLMTAHYNDFYPSNESVLGPYFRNLFHLFKLIDSADMPYAAKCRYANIARASLGPDHIYLLLFNASTQYGAASKPLIEKYGLLKHIPRGGLAEERAYGGLALQIGKFLYLPTAFLGTNERLDYWRNHPERAPSETVQ